MLLIHSAQEFEVNEMMMEIIGDEALLGYLKTLALLTPKEIADLPASFLVSELDRIKAELPDSIEEDTEQWVASAQRLVEANPWLKTFKATFKADWE